MQRFSAHGFARIIAFGSIVYNAMQSHRTEGPKQAALICIRIVFYVGYETFGIDKVMVGADFFWLEKFEPAKVVSVRDERESAPASAI